MKTWMWITTAWALIIFLMVMVFVAWIMPQPKPSPEPVTQHFANPFDSLPAVMVRSQPVEQYHFWEHMPEYVPPPHIYPTVYPLLPIPITPMPQPVNVTVNYFEDVR